MSVNNCNISENFNSTTNNISYSDIALKLLQDKFLLTALELHTELLESGHELSSLREFFSNPGNFEQARPELTSIPRSGSQATLDSLDLTRYSEDGERTNDERVAILEFELRKARETINALRANLTVATESEIIQQDLDTKNSKSPSIDKIKPHEKRALNYLINEYLLSHGYKLTSITFADENENQDFEDWDDVGLNISKPPELTVLYREAMKHTSCNHNNAESQTEDFFINERLQMEAQIENYKLNIQELVSEKLDLQQVIARHQQSVESANETRLSTQSESPVSISPERFEIIEKPEKVETMVHRDSLVTLDDDDATISINETDWSPVTVPSDSTNSHQNSEHDACSSKSGSIINISLTNTTRYLPSGYKRELFLQCYKHVTIKPDPLLDNLSKDSLNTEHLLQMINRSLPKIIPNIILNKREEIIPLILCAVFVSRNVTQRDNLVQQLFNLKKRPNNEERQKILAGLIALAKQSEENMVENEILPQCWEQISHKYIERRLLVIESCIHLVPYVSSAIRNSLVLSIIQQMLTEDREASVRELTVQALALIVGLCDDNDKYSQCEELAFHALNDPNHSVVALANNLLIPVLAKWAMDLGKLQSHLLKKLLKKLKHIVIRTEIISEERIVQTLSTFANLLPFTIVSLTKCEFVLSQVVDDSKNVELRPEFLEMCTPLTNPCMFYEGENQIGEIMFTFQSIVSKDTSATWPELDWFEEIMLQELITITNNLEINHQAALTSMINLFRNISISLGRHYTKTKLKRLFEFHIQNLEHSLASPQNIMPKLCLIPLYLLGILNHSDYLEEIGSTIKNFVCVLPLCGASIVCLEISVRGLCENKELQTVIVAALWDNVVHQQPVVRSTTAALFAAIVEKVEDSLLVNRVTPALITLSSDPEITVRTASIPCIGTLITSCSIKEVHDKAYSQLQCILSEPTLQNEHLLMCQLVKTLGQITNASEPWFREQVIFPQLTNLSHYAVQISNQTRRRDLAVKLIETYSTIIFCPISKQTIGNCLLPGLKFLETIEIPSFNTQREQIASMIRDVESRLDTALPTSPTRPDRTSTTSSLTQNVNQGVEDMRQRMSKIFPQNVVKSVPGNLSNLQGIFKKK